MLYDAYKKKNAKEKRNINGHFNKGCPINVPSYVGIELFFQKIYTF